MSGIDLYFRLKRRTTTHHRFLGCVCPYAVCRDLGMVNFPYYLFSFDFLVADIYLGLQTVIHLLHLPIFTPILIVMLSRRILLPQYKNSFSKAQTLCNVLDIPVAAWNTNSATQQLSNSATRLCPDKRAAFIFSQQHHYFFSSIFADGTSSASVFTFTQKRYFAALGILCALGMQRSRFCKHIINTAFYRRSRPAVWFDSG